MNIFLWLGVAFVRLLAIVLALSPVCMWIYKTMSYNSCECLLFFAWAAILWTIGDFLEKEID